MKRTRTLSICVLALALTVYTLAYSGGIWSGYTARQSASVSESVPLTETANKDRSNTDSAESTFIPTSAFTPGNLVIYRVGDGSASLNTNAAAVFLDEYTPTGTLVQSIAMPTAVNGSQKRLTASGSSTSEGYLTRSVDGQYLLVPGYDAALNAGSITTSTSAAVNRVI